jgi:hypothetical protein
MFRMLAEVGFALQNPVVEFTDMVALEAGLAATGIGREEIRKSVRTGREGRSAFFANAGLVPYPGRRAHTSNGM